MREALAVEHSERAECQMDAKVTHHALSIRPEVTHSLRHFTPRLRAECGHRCRQALILLLPRSSGEERRSTHGRHAAEAEDQVGEVRQRKHVPHLKPLVPKARLGDVCEGGEPPRAGSLG